jgi:predicted transcriptional regulator
MGSEVSSRRLIYEVCMSLARSRNKDKTLLDRFGKGPKKLGWVQVPNILIRHLSGLGLTTSEFAVLFLLITYVSKEHDAHPALSTMAQSLGMSEDTVRRNIRRLEKKGFVEVEYRKQSRDRNLSNVYRFEGLYKAVKRRAYGSLKRDHDKGASSRRAALNDAPAIESLPTEDIKLTENDLPKFDKDTRAEAERLIEP